MASQRTASSQQALSSQRIPSSQRTASSQQAPFTQRTPSSHRITSSLQALSSQRIPSSQQTASSQRTTSSQQALFSQQAPFTQRTPSSHRMTSSPQASSSQLDLATFDNSEYENTPIDPNTTFERIGKGQKYYKWTEEQHLRFLSWWLSTPWVIQHAAELPPNESMTTKLKWNSTTRTSDLWKSYHQAAARDGEPVLICHNCSQPLSHPVYKGTGTNSMKNHRSSRTCRRSSVQTDLQQFRQPNIINAMSQSSLIVSFY